MLPTQSPVLQTQSRPKLGFSIDSLVGRKNQHEPSSSPPPSPGSPRRSPSPRSPTGVFQDVLKPMLRIPEPIHPLLQNSTPQQHLPGMGHGLGGLPGLNNHPAFNLAALLPHSQSMPTPLPPVLLGPPLGQPLPPSHGPREYPLYPWLLSRGRLFGHRFPGEDWIRMKSC